jgi:hypothetical protein
MTNEITIAPSPGFAARGAFYAHAESGAARSGILHGSNQ